MRCSLADKECGLLACLKFTLLAKCALSSVCYLLEVRANLQVYVLPVSCPNWPKPLTVLLELVRKRLKLSYFRETFRCSIMVDG